MCWFVISELHQAIRVTVDSILLDWGITLKFRNNGHR